MKAPKSNNNFTNTVWTEISILNIVHEIETNLQWNDRSAFLNSSYNSNYKKELYIQPSML